MEARPQDDTLHFSEVSEADEVVLAAIEETESVTIDHEKVLKVTVNSLYFANMSTPQLHNALRAALHAESSESLASSLLDSDDETRAELALGLVLLENGNSNPFLSRQAVNSDCDMHNAAKAIYEVCRLEKERASDPLELSQAAVWGIIGSVNDIAPPEAQVTLDDERKLLSGLKMTPRNAN